MHFYTGKRKRNKHEHVPGWFEYTIAIKTLSEEGYQIPYKILEGRFSLFIGNKSSGYVAGLGELEWGTVEAQGSAGGILLFWDYKSIGLDQNGSGRLQVRGAPTFYLGLSLGAPFKSRACWHSVEERVHMKLAMWKKVSERLEIQRDFLWGGGSLENKPHLECLGDVNLGKKAPLGMTWFSCRKEAKEDVEDYPFVYFIVFLEREE
ncbi:hypothetical protein CK203_027860 [Vitis vinifera]|uniref:Uncharacterized protein n=1 Tax=Vitis vinifera TaxID=29760 RepID=A0A438J3B6_VITVI|nr:hypothetical protein CK203_027860 [Vitis vinifera]